MKPSHARDIDESGNGPGQRRTCRVILCGLGTAALLLLTWASAGAQQKPWAQRMADTTLQRWPDGRFVAPGEPWKWNYELGTLLDGMDAVWANTADKRYFLYIRDSVDPFIGADGSIATWKKNDYTLDNVLLGRQLLLLYEVTREPKYYLAARQLRQQLAHQPRNSSGGFWHKGTYPNQMWLDGLYMAEPFYAEYARDFRQPQDFADITKQFSLIYQHTRDPKTGLLYHAWDESKKQPWANAATGDSPNFWARGMGWYMMALVDSLPEYPRSDPGRARLLSILRQTAAAIVRVQDPRTGLWYEVLNRPGAPGNYFESSAACMFTYALAKGVRLGYLPRTYLGNAQLAWQGIQTHFIRVSGDGALTLTGTVKSIGLGGKQHRNGSYHYYVSSPVVSNDPKGVGAYLLAASEMELVPDSIAGRGREVLLDAWFNSQTRENAAGGTEYYHYKWNDRSNTGFWFFGHIFRSYGVSTRTLYAAPTPSRLRGAEYYVIVSPDNPKWNPHPHLMTNPEASSIAAWVRQGGVLLMMANDRGNTDIPHLDLLADRFGLHFNNVLVHHVAGRDFAMGSIHVAASGPFTRPYQLYMKDTCSLTLSKGATALMVSKGETLMAVAHYGRGVAIAVTDPWLYNEYTDGRKLPSSYQNFAAGRDLVRWLLRQR